MKKILLAGLMILGACTRHYQVSLDDACVAEKVEEFRNKVLGRQPYKRLKSRAGILKMDKGVLVFVPAHGADENVILGVEEIVKRINEKGYVELEINEFFEIECFSSPFIPQYTQYQDFWIKVGIEEKDFWAALRYYFEKNKLL